MYLGDSLHWHEDEDSRTTRQGDVNMSFTIPTNYSTLSNHFSDFQTEKNTVVNFI